MDSIISVQDIRTSLGEITSRAEAGETFTVVRNSKPAFRIVPLSPESVREQEVVRETRTEYSAGKRGANTPIQPLKDIRRRLEESGANKMITPQDVAEMIAEVRAEKQRKRREPDHL